MHRKTSALAALAASALVLAGCSQADAGPAATESATADAAPASITLYTSEPQEKIDQIVAAFNERRPEITVEVFRAGTGDLNARIESERATGEVQADVLLAADAPTFEGFAADGLLLELDTADVDALDPAVVDPEGFYVGTRIIPTVIAYNTDVVDAPPASWQELTDPAYADRLVMPNPDVSGAAAFNAAVWLDEAELGEAWLTALAANEPVIVDSNGPTSQAIASGAQPVGVVVDYLVRDLAAAGSPIAVSYPSEGVPFVSQPAGVFASTDEADAAQAFVDFLVSVEGQTIAVEQAYLPVRGDVGTPEGAPAMSDIALLNPDLEVIAATKADAVATFNELFQ
ncbi:ABC transporter substrate-binding protein [Agrococcus beijingensis]|uniref:ABC transporter substrate-binding protein n=1 Tax=Agrococcus beijingensis TaxID=3068634 RepID=UPI00274251C7|nr:ABC transporter substrate-binding protein [Agrococcus sp. REN33]